VAKLKEVSLMSDSKTFYITTPIYYVNDKPHIGHVYTALACDVLARYMRLKGYTVKFLTGTDEHGEKVEKSAIAAGVSSECFVDEVSQNFRDLTPLMNFSNDDFIRTTERRHIISCQALWRELAVREQIYLGKYSGWYSVRDESFVGESDLIKGPGAKKLSPSGDEVEWVSEPSYFFRLSKWREPLLRLYDQRPDFVSPSERMNEVRRFVEEGLQDLAISRANFKWGIPVPDDHNHVMYVWLDALANYITAVGYPNTSTLEYKSFWPANLHIIGKDILRFHAVYWPAFLMAAGLDTPRRIFAHGWWMNEGQKMSKSVGNVIDPIKLVSQYGLDPVRYFLLREVPFGNDGDFSFQSLEARLNSDLANGYGNLVQRVLSIIAKDFSGIVPKSNTFLEEDRFLFTTVDKTIAKVRLAVERLMFHEALELIWGIIREANIYIDRQAPWSLRKSDFERMGSVVYVLADVIRNISILTQPFIPDASTYILDQLSIPINARDFSRLGSSFCELIPGSKLPKPSGVFPRYKKYTN
jgi:methionyl-tRNA synthetase